MVQKVVNNKISNRFEITVDGQTGYLEYNQYKGGMDLRHTFVPEKIGGRGIAAQLVRYALEYARANGLKIKATCSYVKVFLERNLTEFADIEEID
jgi:hypothetical protein